MILAKVVGLPEWWIVQSAARQPIQEAVFRYQQQPKNVTTSAKISTAVVLLSRMKHLLGISLSLMWFLLRPHIRERMGKGTWIFKKEPALKAGFLSPVQKHVAILPPLEKKKELRFHVTPCFIWWSWRELNPRPKFLHPRYYMLSLSLHSHASCGQTRH